MSTIEKNLPPILTKLLHKLSGRMQAGNLRSLNINKGLIDFYSNDYLGLAKDEELLSLPNNNGLNININGSTGSRLLSGNSEQALQLEQFLAGLFNAESALLFNSGYVANLSILSSIPQKGDTIILDEFIHASLKEGARLSYAKCFNFKHNDLSDLEKKLSKSEGDIFVVIESIYSMDGDSAKLREIQALCKSYGANLIVDEAHSTGICGKHGEGMTVESEIEKSIFARVHTFGKAVGAHGACIVGSKILIDYLINFARPFIYSTSLSPHSLTVIYNSLNKIRSTSALRNTLSSNIRFFKDELKKQSIDGSFINSESPIQVCKVPGNDHAKRVSQHLISKGFEVRPILAPTVKAGEERLRICLHSYNTTFEIESLVKELKIAYSTP